MAEHARRRNIQALAEALRELAELAFRWQAEVFSLAVSAWKRPGR